jgi:hypothetical protein
MTHTNLPVRCDEDRMSHSRQAVIRRNALGYG